MNTAAPMYDDHDAHPQAAPDRLTDPTAVEWERTYALFTHLSLLLVHVLMPIVPTLVMWLIKRDTSPFVDDHGKEAVNFQVSLLIYSLAAIPLAFLTCGLGALIYLPIYALAIVGMIMAAMAAHRGEFFRYPACIRFLK